MKRKGVEWNLSSITEFAVDANGEFIIARGLNEGAKIEVNERETVSMQKKKIYLNIYCVICRLSSLKLFISVMCKVDFM